MNRNAVAMPPRAETPDDPARVSDWLQVQQRGMAAWRAELLAQSPPDHDGAALLDAHRCWLADALAQLAEARKTRSD